MPWYEGDTAEQLRQRIESSAVVDQQARDQIQSLRNDMNQMFNNLKIIDGGSPNTSNGA